MDTKPVVHKLNIQSTAGGLEISLGEELPQDLIPENKLGAFRINEDVFVNINNFVVRTDMKIVCDQMTDVDLRAWNEIKAFIFKDQYVWFHLKKEDIS